MSAHDAYVWAAIGGLVAVVFATRNAFLALPRRLHPRGALERALRFAPLAALAALVVPESMGAWLAAGADAAGAWRDPRLPAALAALAVARIARSPLPGLAAGVAVLVAVGALA